MTEDSSAVKQPRQSMLYVGGSEKAYRCVCGCNVFSQLMPEIWRCNSCREVFGGEKATDDMLALFNSRGTFQRRVRPWTVAAFGEAAAMDAWERKTRFNEEAIELLQSLGYSKEDVLTMVEDVYANKTPGDPEQEIGGTMVTLASLCNALGYDMHAAGEKELDRCIANIDKIRAKHATKRLRSPLPGEPSRE